MVQNLDNKFTIIGFQYFQDLQKKENAARFFLCGGFQMYKKLGAMRGGLQAKTIISSQPPQNPGPSNITFSKCLFFFLSGHVRA